MRMKKPIYKMKFFSIVLIYLMAGLFVSGIPTVYAQEQNKPDIPEEEVPDDTEEADLIFKKSGAVLNNSQLDSNSPETVTGDVVKHKKNGTTVSFLFSPIFTPETKKVDRFQAFNPGAPKSYRNYVDVIVDPGMAQWFVWTENSDKIQFGKMLLSRNAARFPLSGEGLYPTSGGDGGDGGGTPHWAANINSDLKLKIERVPEYVFSNSDFWVPIKAKLEGIPEGTQTVKITNPVVNLLFEGSKIYEYEGDKQKNIKIGIGNGTSKNATPSFRNGQNNKKGKLFAIAKRGKGDIKDGEVIFTVFVNNKRAMEGVTVSNEDHLFNSKKKSIPQFQLEVDLKVDGASHRNLTSIPNTEVNSDQSKIGVFADRKVGPVIEEGDTNQSDLRFNDNTEYIGFPRMNEKDWKLKRQRSDLRWVSTDEINPAVSLPYLWTDEKELSSGDYDNTALNFDTEFNRLKVSSDFNSKLWGINIADRENFIEIGNEEYVEAAMKVRKTSHFFLSYKKNSQLPLDIPAMDLSERKNNIRIQPNAFQGQLAMGTKFVSGTNKAVRLFTTIIKTTAMTIIGTFSPPLGLLLTAADTAKTAIDIVSETLNDNSMHGRAEFGAIHVNSKTGERKNPQAWQEAFNFASLSGTGDLIFDYESSGGAGMNRYLVWNLKVDQRETDHFPEHLYNVIALPVGRKVEFVLKFLVIADVNNNGSRQMLGGISFFSPNDYFVKGDKVKFPGED